VRQGENRGKALRHDFVVRRLEGPFAMGADGRVARSLTVTLAPDAKPPDMGVAAFVQRRGNGQILQAVSVADCRAE
jgi:hypothetical protein